MNGLVVQWTLVALHQLKSAEGIMKMSKKMQIIGLVLAMVLTMGAGIARAAGQLPPLP
jgi:hypothetical protein